MHRARRGGDWRVEKRESCIRLELASSIARTCDVVHRIRAAVRRHVAIVIKRWPRSRHLEYQQRLVAADNLKDNLSGHKTTITDQGLVSGVSAIPRAYRPNFQAPLQLSGIGGGVQAASESAV